MKLAVGAAGALGAAVVSMTIFGTGVAAADDYTGLTYAKASAQLSSYNYKVVIASVVGSQLSTDDCIVTHSQKAPWVSATNIDSGNATYLLYLNCNAALASPGVPGNSAASPEGAAEKKKQAKEEWLSNTPDGNQWCTENETAHPNWDFTGCPGWVAPS